MFKRSVPRYSLAGVVLAMALGLGVQAAPGKAPDAPAGWLATTGKDAGWTKATAKCRELLGKLKLDDPVVKSHLPRLKARCLALRKVRSPRGWYEIVPVRFLEAMLADLGKGVEPTKRYAGKGVAFPYWSEKTNRIESIWVHVPPSFDPAKKHQMFLYYKCGGGIHYKDGKAHGGYRPTVEVANQTDTFHVWSSLSVQVKGRMGAVHELTQSVAALARDFSVDPDRVFLTGWSDGGFTALWLGSRYPHLVAGIAPCCANWQYTNVEEIGLFNVPMLAVDGWTDGGYNTSQFIRWHALRTMGYEVAGLWGHHGHSYQPYEDITELKQILDWARAKRRSAWPKRVRYATWNLTWHRAFWFSIERMVEPALAAQIDAEVKGGNRIEVKAWNVAAYKLSLSEKLVDPAKGLTVLTNGKESYSGPFRKELTVEVVKGGGEFVKTAATPGGITAQYDASTYTVKPGGGLKIADRKWMWVKATGGEEGTRKLLAKWFPSWAKADAELTDNDIAGHNLFVLGGPGLNKFAARIAGKLPVKFGKGSFTIGGKVYDQPTNCVKFIHPNPLNPSKYVMVHAFNDAAAFARHRFFGLGSESAWKFRLGDCVVLGVRARQRKWGVAAGAPAFEKVHHIFDSNWQAAGAKPVGELAAPFGAAQILRLRADAIREATGADVGMIGSYTARHVRWRDALPAGPVTLHDLATCDALPKYIMLGEVSGATLAGLVGRASASTVLADEREPAHAEGGFLAAKDIDPKKAYRVAMDYGGTAYRVTYRKMPKLFHFTSPAEFLAGKHTSLPVRNLRHTPLQVAEAVAAYVGKRKKVAPRPVCFDLTEYLADPQANRFGAFDWLHLGADVAWERASGQKVAGRYVLSLALTEAGGPKLAPPRKNSRHFLDVDLTAADKPLSFGFARLDKKLPVAVTVGIRRFAVTADAEGKAFGLATDPAAGAVGRGVLLDVRLSNTGKKDVTGLAALSPRTTLRINGSIWPAGGRGAAKTWYCGFRQKVGQYRKPPVHQNAALFLWKGPAPRLGRLSVKGAGYNFGLVAAHRPVSVKAGETVSLPLLFVFVNKPAKVEALDLAAVLEAIKDKVMPAGG